MSYRTIYAQNIESDDLEATRKHFTALGFENISFRRTGATFELIADTKAEAKEKSLESKEKPILKHNCKHDNGYVLIDSFCVAYPRFSLVNNDDFECLFQCNNIGCKHTIKLKFDVTNIEEVRE